MHNRLRPIYWLYTDNLGNLENKAVRHLKLADVLANFYSVLGKPSKSIVAIVLNQSDRIGLNYEDFLDFE